MHAIQVYLQTNQIQRHFVVKAVFVLQTVVFQGSTPYWSASVGTRESSLINASAQNVTQHHYWYSLMGYFIQPSNHIENFEKRLVEDNWVENHGLMKQIHQIAVKCIFNLFLLSSVILPIYYLWQFTLTSPQLGTLGVDTIKCDTERIHKVI